MTLVTDTQPLLPINTSMLRTMIQHRTGSRILINDAKKFSAFMISELGNLGINYNPNTRDGKFKSIEHMVSDFTNVFALDTSVCLLDSEMSAKERLASVQRLAVEVNGLLGTNIQIERFPLNPGHPRSVNQLCRNIIDVTSKVMRVLSTDHKRSIKRNRKEIKVLRKQKKRLITIFDSMMRGDRFGDKRQIASEKMYDARVKSQSVLNAIDDAIETRGAELVNRLSAYKEGRKWLGEQGVTWDKITGDFKELLPNDDRISKPFEVDMIKKTINAVNTSVSETVTRCKKTMNITDKELTDELVVSSLETLIKDETISERDLERIGVCAVQLRAAVREGYLNDMGEGDVNYAIAMNDAGEISMQYARSTADGKSNTLERLQLMSAMSDAGYIINADMINKLTERVTVAIHKGIITDDDARSFVKTRVEKTVSEIVGEINRQTGLYLTIMEQSSGVASPTDIKYITYEFAKLLGVEKPKMTINTNALLGLYKSASAGDDGIDDMDSIESWNNIMSQNLTFYDIMTAWVIAIGLGFVLHEEGSPIARVKIPKIIGHSQLEKSMTSFYGAGMFKESGDPTNSDIIPTGYLKLGDRDNILYNDCTVTIDSIGNNPFNESLSMPTSWKTIYNAYRDTYSNEQQPVVYNTDTLLGEYGDTIMKIFPYTSNCWDAYTVETMTSQAAEIGRDNWPKNISDFIANIKGYGKSAHMLTLFGALDGTRNKINTTRVVEFVSLAMYAKSVFNSTQHDITNVHCRYVPTFDVTDGLKAYNDTYAMEYAVDEVLPLYDTLASAALARVKHKWKTNITGAVLDVDNVLKLYEAINDDAYGIIKNTWTITNDDTNIYVNSMARLASISEELTSINSRYANNVIVNESNVTMGIETKYSAPAYNLTTAAGVGVGVAMGDDYIDNINDYIVAHNGHELTAVDNAITDATNAFINRLSAVNDAVIAAAVAANWDTLVRNAQANQAAQNTRRAYIKEYFNRVLVQYGKDYMSLVKTYCPGLDNYNDVEVKKDRVADMISTASFISKSTALITAATNMDTLFQAGNNTLQVLNTAGVYFNDEITIIDDDFVADVVPEQSAIAVANTLTPLTGLIVAVTDAVTAYTRATLINEVYSGSILCSLDAINAFKTAKAVHPNDHNAPVYTHTKVFDVSLTRAINEQYVKIFKYLVDGLVTTGGVGVIKNVFTTTNNVIDVVSVDARKAYQVFITHARHIGHLHVRSNDIDTAITSLTANRKSVLGLLHTYLLYVQALDDTFVDASKVTAVETLCGNINMDQLKSDGHRLHLNPFFTIILESYNKLIDDIVVDNNNIIIEMYILSTIENLFQLRYTEVDLRYYDGPDTSGALHMSNRPVSAIITKLSSNHTYTTGALTSVINHINEDFSPVITGGVYSPAPNKLDHVFGGNIIDTNTLVQIKAYITRTGVDDQVREGLQIAHETLSLLQVVGELLVSNDIKITNTIVKWADDIILMIKDAFFINNAFNATSDGKVYIEISNRIIEIVKRYQDMVVSLLVWHGFIVKNDTGVTLRDSIFNDNVDSIGTGSTYMESFMRIIGDAFKNKANGIDDRPNYTLQPDIDVDAVISYEEQQIEFNEFDKYYGYRDLYTTAMEAFIQLSNRTLVGVYNNNDGGYARVEYSKIIDPVNTVISELTDINNIYTRSENTYRGQLKEAIAPAAPAAPAALAVNIMAIYKAMNTHAIKTERDAIAAAAITTVAAAPVVPAAAPVARSTVITNIHACIVAVTAAATVITDAVNISYVRTVVSDTFDIPYRVNGPYNDDTFIQNMTRCDGSNIGINNILDNVFITDGEALTTASDVTNVWKNINGGIDTTTHPDDATVLHYVIASALAIAIKEYKSSSTLKDAHTVMYLYNMLYVDTADVVVDVLTTANDVKALCNAYNQQQQQLVINEDNKYYKTMATAVNLTGIKKITSTGYNAANVVSVRYNAKSLYALISTVVEEIVIFGAGTITNKQLQVAAQPAQPAQPVTLAAIKANFDLLSNDLNTLTDAFKTHARDNVIPYTGQIVHTYTSQFNNVNNIIIDSINTYMSNMVRTYIKPPATTDEGKTVLINTPTSKNVTNTIKAVQNMAVEPHNNIVKLYTDDDHGYKYVKNKLYRYAKNIEFTKLVALTNIRVRAYGKLMHDVLISIQQDSAAFSTALAGYAIAQIPVNGFSGTNIRIKGSNIMFERAVNEAGIEYLKNILKLFEIGENNITGAQNLVSKKLNEMYTGDADKHIAAVNKFIKKQSMTAKSIDTAGLSANYPRIEERLNKLDGLLTDITKTSQFGKSIVTYISSIKRIFGQ